MRSAADGFEVAEAPVGSDPLELRRPRADELAQRLHPLLGEKVRVELELREPTRRVRAHRLRDLAHAVVAHGVFVEAQVLEARVGAQQLGDVPRGVVLEVIVVEKESAQPVDRGGAQRARSGLTLGAAASPAIHKRGLCWVGYIRLWALSAQEYPSANAK